MQDINIYRQDINMHPVDIWFHPKDSNFTSEYLKNPCLDIKISGRDFITSD